MNDIKKNDIFEAITEGYTSEALGVCRIDGRPVFVPGAIAGEKLNVKITKVNSSAIYGRIENIISPAESRIEPACPHYKQCGGCSTLHMNYDEELKFKLGRVNDALVRIGRQSVTADEIIPAQSRNCYRNKVTFQVSQSENGAYFGYYSPRTHLVIPVKECAAVDSRALEIAKAVIDFINKYKILPYDENNCKGAVRHIFIRKSVYTEDICLCVSSAEGFGKNTSAFVSYITNVCPYVTGIVLNINKKPGNELLYGDYYTLSGKPDITDLLYGYKFRISPQSFYQVNPVQAEKLYAIAADFAGSGKGTCLDLYCGIGTISHCLSKNFTNIIGVEVVPQAIENAKYNAELNNVHNIDFLCADASGALEMFRSEGIRIDAAVVDPPRKGMDSKAIETVCCMNAERIVYVSCNPSTLARDLTVFNENGYKLEKAKAVDMFPGTFHVETVVQLVRKKPDTYLDVKIDIRDIDVTTAEAKATYDEIKDYIFEKYSVRVSSLNIAQVKEKYGIKERENYNKSKNADAKQPQCPKAKEQIIIEALKHFKMVTE